MTDKPDIVEMLSAISEEDARERPFLVCLQIGGAIEEIERLGDDNASYIFELKALRKQVEDLKSDNSFLRNYAEEARFDALEEAAKLVEEGVDRPGIKIKQDTCPHSKYGWEDCEDCCVAAIRALKTKDA